MKTALFKESLLRIHNLNMPEDIEIQALSLLRRFEGRLPQHDYTEIESLIVHREWGIGLENLCQQLYEYNISVEPEDLAAIRSLAQTMRLDPKCWNFLIEKQ